MTPEGKEEEQEIKNLFEKVMKENFPDLVKETDISPGSTESQTSWTQRGPLQRHIIIKKQKVKDKERILKAAREKQRVTCKGAPRRLSVDF